MNNYNMYQGGMYQNNMGGFAPSGYGQQQSVPVQKTKNALTPEEIKSLRKNVGTFSLALTREEVLRGICTHKDENGAETLRENADGSVTCSVCGYTFDPKQNCTEDILQGYVADIVDVLQTIKLLYIDIPAETAREYFQLIPLIEKIPKLFKVASENFNRHENSLNYRYNGTPSTINLYQMLNNGSLNTGYATQMPYQQQPMYNDPMMAQQPVGMGMPYQQPQFQQSNGFGYPGAVPQPQGYQPTTVGFEYTPNQTNINNQPTGTLPQNNAAYAQQPPLASPTALQTPVKPVTTEVAQGTTAPTNVAATTDGKEVKVASTFKS